LIPSVETSAGSLVESDAIVSQITFTVGKSSLKAADAEKQVALKAALGALDAFLLTRTFLVGESLSITDVKVASSLWSYFENVLDASYRAQFPNVVRHFLTVVNQPGFKALVGDIKLCTVPTVYSDKPVAEAVKPKAKAKADDDEEEEEKFDDEPKGKNPLDALPASTFSLEAWKRFYSNNDEDVALKHFWENLDRQGFSVWKCAYKYNSELLQIFKSCNLLNGFFQRCESVRKYAFGSFCIFGQDNENEIVGLWVFRGQDVPAEFADIPDTDSYDFTKYDLDNEAHKTEINAVLAWTELNGVGKFPSAKAFNQGKNFK